MRHATYFVYYSDQESSLAAMFRERLQSQGVVAINLQKQVEHLNRLTEAAKTFIHLSLLTALPVQPLPTKE